MNLPRTRPSDLFIWKLSECPDCVYAGRCQKKLADLDTCFKADVKSFEGAEKMYLIKRTIRHLVKHVYRGTRPRPTSKLKFRIVQEPTQKTDVFRGATLYCSHISILKECQRSR